ncbi:MAG: S-methyl-5-thioribose-1-phosphate isomerase [Pirellula sp.]|jgi:methylthioribose-1-phosphate isomerase|nr:S-methyl-5-thioribose-1-phosphate isomerase [Pirellula sp.]
MNTEVPYASVAWSGDTLGALTILDQTLLPLQEVQLELRNVESVHEAIVALRVRGAPAIGITAAYGVVVALQDSIRHRASTPDAAHAALQACDYLATSRPTAVNLFWALDRMRRTVSGNPSVASAVELGNLLLRQARLIHDEDRKMCHAIGEYGASLLSDGFGVLTHCNTGGLATSEYGTALAAIFTAHRSGKKIHVYADETRPLLQGARLTMWELQRYGVPSTLICDSMAAQVMREGKIQAVIVGADRITARGDTANKIGTYGVAIAAHHHRIPFYVAAPTSTFDVTITSGDEIPIEQRKPEEITHGFGRRTAPEGISVYNPAFDVTPAEYITAIVTERGIIHPLEEGRIRRMVVAESS